MQNNNISKYNQIYTLYTGMIKKQNIRYYAIRIYKKNENHVMILSLYRKRNYKKNLQIYLNNR